MNMNVDNLSRVAAINQTQKQNPFSKDSKTSFMDMMQETQKGRSAGKSGAVTSAAEMSMEEYKRYILTRFLNFHNGYNGGKGEELFVEKSKSDFWQKRKERHKESMEQLQEYQAKARMLDKERTEKFNSGRIGPNGEVIYESTGVSAASLFSGIL